MSNINGDPTETFDYVIVGAGAAGSILANRLSEDGKSTVCVLEAGPSDWHPFLHIPAGFIKVLFDPAFTWQFSSEPTDNTKGRRIPIPQGRTLGGSTAINGLAYNRGQPRDFDAWAAAGNKGWGYADVLPYFKRSERKVGGGDDAYHGRAGEQAVTDMDWFHPVCEAFIAGAVGQGIPRNPDYNGVAQEGVGYYQRTILNGWRQSAARSFLRPAKGRKISGIGRGSLLQSLNVPLVHELPGVGENLRDHFSVRMVAKVKGSVTMNELSRGGRLGAQIARWMLGRPNILALSPSLVHWFWKSNEGLNAPDLQGVFTPASYREGYIGMLDNYPGMTCGVWQHRPESLGYVHARSSNPLQDPIVQPNYLEDPRDQQVLLGGMRVARRLMKTPELLKFFDTETLPGSGVTTDDELLDYARSVGVSCYHVMGTSRMGASSDPSAVVDDELRVHGVTGLRVADASVMPSMPSANTCASTMMIAEKAADMIRGLPPLQRQSPDAAMLPGATATSNPTTRQFEVHK